MFEDQVKELLKKALEDEPSLFLIALNIKPDNSIEVIIDGDQGVKVEDCIAISRAIEHNLDREEQDFSLQVMSAGVSEGLVHNRQYKKNIGRKLKVWRIDGEVVEGELITADEEGISLSWKTREPKPVGKGKITVTKQSSIKYEEIKQAKVMITF